MNSNYYRCLACYKPFDVEDAKTDKHWEGDDHVLDYICPHCNHANPAPDILNTKPVVLSNQPTVSGRKTLYFMQTELDGCFYPDDIVKLLKVCSENWGEDVANNGVIPISVADNNTYLFGFIPAELDERTDFDMAVLEAELNEYANDWNHSPVIDPKFGYDIMVVDVLDTPAAFWK